MRLGAASPARKPMVGTHQDCASRARATLRAHVPHRSAARSVAGRDAHGGSTRTPRDRGREPERAGQKRAGGWRVVHLDLLLVGAQQWTAVEDLVRATLLVGCLGVPRHPASRPRGYLTYGRYEETHEPRNAVSAAIVIIVTLTRCYLHASRCDRGTR
eukprot:2190141-Prymnesium_polylepis.1